MFISEKQAVFEKGSSETLEKLTRQHILAKQIERMSHASSHLLEDQAMAVEAVAATKAEGLVYGIMDGSMILTREEDRKEMKLDRIFKRTLLDYLKMRIVTLQGNPLT